MNEKKEDNRRTTVIANAFCVSCFLFLSIPYLIIATYAGPSADDFSNLNHTLGLEGSNFLIKAIHASIDTFKGWQGTYFGNTFTFVGGALYHYGGVFALHIEYFINVLVYFMSSLFLFLRIFKKIDMTSSKRIGMSFIVTALFNLMILYDYDVSEVFYWHTGLAIYTLPMSFAILAIACVLKDNLSRIEVIIVAILAFCAAGGALDISAFVTGSLLLIAFYKSYTSKRFDRTISCFVIALIGSLINCLAPGNFVRHAVISDKFPIADSFRYGFTNTFKAIWEYVGNGTIILLFCLCLLLFNHLKETNIKFVNPFVMGGVLFLGSIIIDFPVYLGYASGELPLRCLFVRKVSMGLFIIISAINLTGWLSKKVQNGFTYKKEFVAIMIGIVLIASTNLFPRDCWNTVKPFKIWNDLCFIESLQSYESTNNYIIETLRSNEGNDVVLNVPTYDTLGYLKSIGLTDNPENWVNTAVSGYFHNNSIVFTVGAE